MEYHWYKIEGPCQNCGKQNLVADHDTGLEVCLSCDTVQDFDNYYDGPFTDDGGGTNIRFGQTEPASVTDHKIFKAQNKKLIEELSSKLGLSRTRRTRVKSLVNQITDLGEGDVSPVLVGACICVAMKRALPVAEVADVVRCDERELGGMIIGVVDFLHLKLPQFDIVGTFECWINKCSSFFGGVCRDVVERMLGQGVFLLRCLIKWRVTRGWEPVPVVVAVSVVVAQLNRVPVKIEDVAYELNCLARECRVRYKEILERLVKIVRTLPFGKHVTKENILENAPIVIKYMEMKSMNSTKSSDMDGLSGLDHVTNPNPGYMDAYKELLSREELCCLGV